MFKNTALLLLICFLFMVSACNNVDGSLGRVGAPYIEETPTAPEKTPEMPDETKTPTVVKESSEPMQSDGTVIMDAPATLLDYRVKIDSLPEAADASYTALRMSVYGTPYMVFSVDDAYIVALVKEDFTLERLAVISHSAVTNDQAMISSYISSIFIGEDNSCYVISDYFEEQGGFMLRKYQKNSMDEFILNMSANKDSSWNIMSASADSLYLMCSEMSGNVFVLDRELKLVDEINIEFNPLYIDKEILVWHEYDKHTLNGVDYKDGSTLWSVDSLDRDIIKYEDSFFIGKLFLENQDFSDNALKGKAYQVTNRTAEEIQTSLNDCYNGVRALSDIYASTSIFMLPTNHPVILYTGIDTIEFLEDYFIIQ